MMKLRTHYVFSLGLLYLVDSLVSNDPFYSIMLAIIISVVGNNLIDSLGHEVKGRYIARSPRTHTFYRSILWGLSISLPLLVLYYVFPSFYFTLSVALDGLLVGPSHMILDIFTERGIYRKVNGRWSRVALAHFSYDNPLANGLATLLGVLMLFAAIHYHNYDYYHYFP